MSELEPAPGVDIPSEEPSDEVVAASETPVADEAVEESVAEPPVVDEVAAGDEQVDEPAEDEEAVFVNIVGEIHPDDVAKLGDHFDIDELNHIEIDTKKKHRR